MPKARFDIPTIPAQVPSVVTRPLYAGVGATDRVVAVVREAVADVQKRASAVTKEVSSLDLEPQALRRQATQVVTTGVAGLQAEAKDLPVRIQRLVDEQVTVAGDAYGALIKRGETLVGLIRRQPSTSETVAAAETTVAKAKTTRTQTAKTASAATRSATRTTKKAAKSPARSSAKATTTAAKKTAKSAVRATSDAAKKVGA